LYLLGVHMSVINILHTNKILLDANPYDGYTTHLDKIVTDERPQEFPSPGKAPVSFRNNDNVDNGEFTKEKNGNQVQEMVSQTIISKIQSLEDNPTNDSTSIKSHNNSSSRNFGKTTYRKYNNKLEEASTSVDISKYLPQNGSSSVALNNHNINNSTIEDELAAESNTSDYGSFSFMSMFLDKHLRSKMHSGVIIYDLAFEERCVDGWRNEIDTF